MNSGDLTTYDNFIKELSRLQTEPTFDRSEYENHYDNEVLEWYLDNNNWNAVVNLLQKHKIPYNTHVFPTGVNVITIEETEEPSDWYVVEIQNNQINWQQDARQWVRDNVDYSYLYIPEDSGAEFWDELGDNAVAYHRTVEENVQSIQKHGLLPKNNTRGMSNANTGSAVFASWDYENTTSYGEYIFEINLSRMKQDGYMPQVSQEEPVAEGEVEGALAHGIGISDYYVEIEQGIDSDTIVIFGKIPPKYLRLL